MGIGEFSAIVPSGLTGSSEFMGLGAAASPASETAFALLYNEALELTSGQELEIAGENVDEQEEVLSIADYAGPAFADGMGLKRFPGKPTQARERLAWAPSLALQPASPSDTTGVLNKSRLAEWMDAHALSRSTHHCAMFCRQGLEAAGLSTADRPRSGDAGDYGPFLMRHGAQVVPLEGYSPQVGDTVVFNKTEQHPNGHIEMYDGRQWVSDFVQHSFSPYHDSAGPPPFTIYRLS